MDSFNIWVVRNTQSKFPHFVSLSDDACVAYIQKYALQGVEVGEATVVSNEILLSFKDQLLHANNLLEASKGVMDNQVKDLADAGRALARLQREIDQRDYEIGQLQAQIGLKTAENEALKAQVRNAQLQGGGL